MKKQLIALGAFLVLALGTLPSMAWPFKSCPCDCDCPKAEPCCPKLEPCCPKADPCCPKVEPCCDPCKEYAPCPAAKIQEPCQVPYTNNDCCD